MSETYLFEKSVTRYSIEIPMEDFELLLEAESFSAMYNRKYSRELYILLTEIDGVMNVDYSGHYMNYIFLDIVAHRDNARTQIKIKRMIARYIKSIRERKSA